MTDLGYDIEFLHGYFDQCSASPDHSITSYHQKLLLKYALRLCAERDTTPINNSWYRSTVAPNGNLVYVDQKDLIIPKGTHGSFLGWCPFMDIEELELFEDDISPIHNTVWWNRYCERAFNICTHSMLTEYTWLFGADWDNSVHNFLLRVIYLIETGTIPTRFQCTRSVYQSGEWKRFTLFLTHMNHLHTFGNPL